MNFYAYIRAKRFGISADAAINYTEHDNRYHDGRYDQATMTCKMRDAEAEGDLVDVLNAEQEEAEYHKAKNSPPSPPQKPMELSAHERYGKSLKYVAEACKKAAAEGKALPLLPDDAQILVLGSYFGFWKELVHGVKEGDAKAIADAGRILAQRLPTNAVVVPMPSHDGRATNTLQLAEAIAQNDHGISVADVLRAEPHESSYEQKKRGELPKPIAMRLDGAIPPNRPVYVVDNVVGSGVTSASALKALPKGTRIAAISETLASSARSLFSPPNKSQEQVEQRPRTKPEWIRRAQEEHPAKVVMDEYGNPVVTLQFPEGMPKRFHLGRNSESTDALDWLRRERGTSIEIDRRTFEFDANVKEYAGAKYVDFLVAVQNTGIKDNADKKLTEGSYRLSTRSEHDRTSQPDNAAKNQTADIIARTRAESKAKPEDFENLSEEAKKWAARTLRAKKAIIPYLPEIVANATNGRHLTQSEMLASSSAEHASKKRGPKWAGGCYYYDVRFAVPDHDGTPRTYKGRLMLGEDWKKKRFFYDILDLDDGSGFQPYFEERMKAYHAAKDAEKGSNK